MPMALCIHLSAQNSSSSLEHLVVLIKVCNFHKIPPCLIVSPDSPDLSKRHSCMFPFQNYIQFELDLHYIRMSKF